ncbi:MAG: hypothetical protein U1E70_25960 [Acetobacteraceae bacterium]
MRGAPRLSWALGSTTPELLCQFGPAATVLSGVEVRPPPATFLQATREGEVAIAAAVAAGLPPPAGPGADRRSLRWLWYIELRIGRVRSRCCFRRRQHFGECAEGRGQRAAPAGRVEAYSVTWPANCWRRRSFAGFAAVVLDLPHAGAPAQVAQIAASSVPTVIYVSCNPATLGRDAAVLRQGGYRLTAATAIDQFLWSARLEAVCVFRRGR